MSLLSCMLPPLRGCLDRHPRSFRFQGFTLAEMLLVLIFLAAAAVLVVVVVDKSADMAREESTRFSLVQIRNAIVGVEKDTGYLNDVGSLPFELTDLFVKPLSTPHFDPQIGRGWRGPYLKIHGDPAIVDGWGEEIIIQIPDSAHSRLVSSGPDGTFQTPADQLFPAKNSCGDDFVLYLLVADQRP